jgi:hypothetical protein
MWKVWPPYRDAFSISSWAASMSLSVNLVLGGLIALRFLPIYEVYLLCFPGFLSYMLVTHQDFEVAKFSWVALIVAAVANYGFYYLVTWLMIRFFRPGKATPWWPEKRS